MDWLRKCFITAFFHLCQIIGGDIPQTISHFFDGNFNTLNNFLGIPSQSETWIEPILQHHSGDRTQILTGGIRTYGLFVPSTPHQMMKLVWKYHERVIQDKGNHSSYVLKEGYNSCQCPKPETVQCIPLDLFE